MTDKEPESQIRIVASEEMIEDEPTIGYVEDATRCCERDGGEGPDPVTEFQEPHKPNEPHDQYCDGSGPPAAEQCVPVLGPEWKELGYTTDGGSGSVYVAPANTAAPAYCGNPEVHSAHEYPVGKETEPKYAGPWSGHCVGVIVDWDGVNITVAGRDVVVPPVKPIQHRPVEPQAPRFPEVDQADVVHALMGSSLGWGASRRRERVGLARELMRSYPPALVGYAFFIDPGAPFEVLASCIVRHEREMKRWFRGEYDV